MTNIELWNNTENIKDAIISNQERLDEIAVDSVEYKAIGMNLKLLRSQLRELEANNEQ